MSTVKITSAHKYYNRGRSNELHVMDDITLELPASGLVAIFGPSGCGKTTLLNAIGGLDKIVSGSIEVFDQSIREDTDTLRNRYIGYIFQNYNLDYNDTVYGNVAAALRLCGLSDEADISERVTAALANVGMDKYAARTPDTLSGGQQQRVAIARALVKNPAIILADEPTGNLDESNTVLVMDILKEISRTHLVLLVTHEESLVDYYCDRVIELQDGRLVGDRENRDANGYVPRDKNDIYLGELPRTDTETPGVILEYYGDASATPLRLRVVHHGGKLYLQTDDPNVKLLDQGSELRLREGVFTETPRKEGKDTARHLDMSRLTPVDGDTYGRLYHWRNATAAAWRENFSGKQRKRRRGLRVFLVMLAIVMVFMTASFGAGLKSYIDLLDHYNEHRFYIPLDPAADYSAVTGAVGRNGIDYIRISGSNTVDNTDYLSFRSAAFMTGVTTSLSAWAQVQDIAHSEGLRLVAGERSGVERDILITTAVADKLLESSTLSYISSHDDLIGLTSESWNYLYRQPLRIGGVVESDEYIYYLSSITLARRLLNEGYWLPITPLSDSIEADTATLAPGEVIFIDNGFVNMAELKQGSTFTLLGKTFTVKSVISPTFDDMEDADLSDSDYKPDLYGQLDYTFILSDADYISLGSSVGPTDEALGFATYEIYDFGWGSQHSHHLLVMASDPAAAEAYLVSTLGRDAVITPDDVLSEAFAEIRTVTIVAIVSVLVVLALMCLCVFFIMRSSFMARVREVGILRAIGVTRRNLTFRFGVETGLLILLTLVAGYLASAWFIGSLSGAPLLSEIFYFPLWLGAPLLAVICAASLLFGILPALLLLRRTPSEILAKYDI